MAEALGVAGSVVGIISLGIQISQGFLQYYESWKSQDEDIADMCVSLENLLRTLVVISETIQPPTKFTRSVVENVEKNVGSTKQAIDKLCDELRQVQNLGIPKQGARALMRRHLRRALYPFKKPTLSKIEQAVGEARSNLGPALDALQLSGTTGIRREIDKIVKWHEDDEIHKILHWLSPENFWLKQGDVSSQRQPGTGEWLLNHPDFLAWAEGNMGVIWCEGGPGVGKTVLSSAVIQFLEEDLPVQEIGLAFIYCDHKRNESQRLEFFIGAIVRQLVQRKQTTSKYVQILYEEHRRKESRPTLNEYLDLLQSLSAEFTEVYVVIDALDECINSKRETVWNDLHANLKKRVTNLRLLCTSRHTDCFGKTSPSSTCIEIRATDKDMETYIQAQIESQSRLFELCRQDTNLQSDILQTVVSKAEGMFLVAQLFVKSLASEKNLRAVKRALKAMPTTTDEIYDQTMDRIKGHPDEHLAKQALCWIVYATRPLSVQEVQHAIAIDDLEPEDGSVAKESLTPPAFIVEACAGLAKIDEESNVIGLVHKTTQEYFDRKGAIHFPNPHSDIGTRCLKYLSLDVFSNGTCPTDEHFESRLSENKLLDYSAQNFGNHIREGTGYELRDLTLKYLMDARKVPCTSQVIFAANYKWRFRNYSQECPGDFLGIHLVTYLGLMDISRCLVENPAIDIESRDAKGRTPLWWAAERGHEGIVKLLLDTGKVDADSKDKYGQTPLWRAAEGGHEGIVKLLRSASKTTS